MVGGFGVGVAADAREREQVELAAAGALGPGRCGGRDGELAQARGDDGYAAVRFIPIAVDGVSDGVDAPAVIPLYGDEGEDSLEFVGAERALEIDGGDERGDVVVGGGGVVVGGRLLARAVCGFR